MATIHTSREALTEPGVVKGVSLEAHDETNEIVLTIECSTSALTDALYEELAAALDGDLFRVGPLALRWPKSAKEG